jgi:glycerophosphoryl diester phosphodiesterase
MLRLAHRGDHRRARENTIEALRAALAVPSCDGIEFDVRASADGVPILLHDDTLGRVFGSPGRASALDAAELGPIGVPSLAEALMAAPAPAFLDIELKEDVVGASVPVIRAARGDPPAGVVVSSFDPAVLALLRALAPDWPTWLNARDLAPTTIRRAADLGCAAISVRWPAVGSASVAAAREAGLDVAAWTVTDPGTADRLGRLGVVALCVEGQALDGAT